MIPNWSDKSPQQRAKKVYRDASWSFVALSFLAYIPLYLALSALVDHLFNVPFSPWMSGLMGIGPMLLMGVGHVRGINALRRAGWLREETQIVERVGAVSAGETVEIVHQSSIGSKLFALAFWVGFGSLGWFVWSRNPTDTTAQVIGGICMAIAPVLLMLTLLWALRRRVLRINDTGIFDSCGACGTHNLKWNRVANVHFERVWGLPPDFSPSDPVETISLQDARGTVLATFNAATFSGMPPAQKQQFIAELRHRLTGDNAPSATGNSE